jgi:hypothetical protein
VARRREISSHREQNRHVPGFVRGVAGTDDDVDVPVDLSDEPDDPLISHLVVFSRRLLDLPPEEMWRVKGLYGLQLANEWIGRNDAVTEFQ